VTQAITAKHATTQRRQYSTEPHDDRNLTSVRERGREGPANEILQQLPLEDRRLLGRARLHGIHTLDQLHFEADLGHNDDIGSRLLDRPERRQDLDLWLFLLEVNRQYRGLNGVKATWRGLVYRGQKVELETHNANARDLIDAIIYTGITEDLDFLREVVRHCLHLQYFMNDLFVAVIGGLLRYRPDQASSMVSRLKASCYHGRHDLMQVFRMACDSTEQDAMKSFQGVLDQIPETDLYDETIPYLWERKRSADAFALHEYFLARRDRPKSKQDLDTFIAYLAYSGQPLEPFLKGLRAGGLGGYHKQAVRIYKQEVQRLLVQENASRGIDFDYSSVKRGQRRTLGDHTIARVFATTAFSFEFLINAVSTFGVVEIGPLALRQMVLSSPDLATLDARYKRLSELEIDTDSSVYAIIVNRLRESRNWKLLRLIAESDMHHDEFANRDLQRRLLNQYLLQGSKQDLTRTLVILNEGRTDQKAQEYSLNVLIRSAAINHDWRLVLHMITSLHQTNFRLSATILHQLIEMLLPSSNSGRSGFHSTFRHIPNFDVPTFLIGILQQLLATRTNISPSHWRRPIVSLAHSSRIEQVHALSVFLADHYTSPRRNVDADSDLSKLFTPLFQRALIAWDFVGRKWRDTLLPKSVNESTTMPPAPEAGVADDALFDEAFFPQPTTPSNPTDAVNVPWLQGANLLKNLRDKHGLKISLPELEKEYLLRIKRMALGQGNLKVASNKDAARACGYSYRDFADGWAALWSPSLPGMPLPGKDNEVSEATNSDRKNNINNAGGTQDGAASLFMGPGPNEGGNGHGRLTRGLERFLDEVRSGRYAEKQARRANKRLRAPSS
jgi:hypothetical protein